MGKIIRMTLEEAVALHEKNKKDPGYMRHMKHLANIRDEDIDFSDTPEVKFTKAWRPGRGGSRPGAGRPRTERIPVTIRLLPSVARHLRETASKEGTTLSEVAERAIAGI